MMNAISQLLSSLLQKVFSSQVRYEETPTIRSFSKEQQRILFKQYSRKA